MRTPSARMNTILATLLAVALLWCSVKGEIPTNVTFSEIPATGTPPERRYGYSLVYIEESSEIQLFGGQNDVTLFNDMYVFSLEDHLWRVQSVVGTSPEERAYHTAVLVGDYVYMFGGLGESGSLDDLWYFSLTAYNWKKAVIIGIDAPSARYYPSAFTLPAYEDKLFIYGGFSQFGELGDVWSYDINTQRFSRVSMLNFDKDSAGGVVLPYSDTAAYVVTGSYDFLGVYSFNFSSPLQANATRLNKTGNVYPIPRYIFAAGLHNGNIYTAFGWSDDLEVSFNDMWVFDTATEVWEEEGPFNSTGIGARDSVSCVVVGDLIYYFGGWGDEIYNDLYYYSTATHNASVIHGSHEAPSPRAFHSSALIGDTVYVFGGRTSKGLNQETWAYGMESEVWTEVPVSGNLPSPRHSHVTVGVGLRMLLFGGESESGVMSDVWEFSALDNSWRELTVGGPSQIPRAGHAAVGLHDLSAIFVTGGYSVSGDLGDSWLFDYLTNTWVALTNSGATPEGSYAAAVSSGDTVIISGGFSGGEERSEVYTITVDTDENVAYWSEFDNLRRSAHAQESALLGSHVFFFSGLWYDELDRTASFLYAGDPIWGIGSGSSSSYTSSSSYSSSSSSSYYNYCGSESVVVMDPQGRYQPRAGGVAEAFGAHVFVFGGVGTVTPESVSALLSYYNNDVYVAAPRPLCNVTGNVTGLISSGDARDCVMCTPGTHHARELVNATQPTSGSLSNYTLYNSVEVCRTCDAGWFSSVAGSAECEPCSEGYYGALPGGSSFQACIPCPTGTYNDAPGRSSCKACNTEKYDCPLGSVYPTKKSNERDSVRQSQPVEDDGALAAEEIRSALITLSIVCALVLFLVLVLFVSTVTFTPEKWENLDLVYNLAHLVPVGTAVSKRKTAVGGLFSILLVIAVAFLTSYVLIPIVIENTSQSRSVVPTLLLLDTVVTSEMVVTLELVDYAGECVGARHPNSHLRTCPRGLDVFADNALETHPKGVDETEYEPPTVSCAVTESGCEVAWRCPTCAFRENNAQVQFVAKTQSAFASELRWSINTSAAIPAQSSSVKGTLRPNEGYVFRGVDPASRIRMSVVPVLYTILFNETLESGHVVSYVSGTQGAQVTSTTFHSTNGIQFIIELESTTTTLDIQVDTQLKVEVVLAAVLGAVSAVVGFGAFAMKLVERVLQRFTESHEAKRKLAAEEANGSQSTSPSKNVNTRGKQRSTGAALTNLRYRSNALTNGVGGKGGVYEEPAPLSHPLNGRRKKGVTTLSPARAPSFDDHVPAKNGSSGRITPLQTSTPHVEYPQLFKMPPLTEGSTESETEERKVVPELYTATSSSSTTHVPDTTTDSPLLIKPRLDWSVTATNTVVGSDDVTPMVRSDDVASRTLVDQLEEEVNNGTRLAGQTDSSDEYEPEPLFAKRRTRQIHEREEDADSYTIRFARADDGPVDASPLPYEDYSGYSDDSDLLVGEDAGPVQHVYRERGNRVRFS